MIQINLLPVRAKKRRVTGKQVFYAYLASIAATITVIGMVWILQEDQVSGLNKQVAEIKAEVDKFAKYEAILQDVTKKKEIIDKKRELIRGLQQDRDTIVRLMALISAEIPAEKVWLEKLLQTANSLTVDGLALSNEAIAEFMRNLESSPYVIRGTVNLTHSRQTMVSNVKLREFQLTCQFMPFSQVQKMSRKEGS
jgi:type IV pilus assembly protein PilN